MDPSSRHSEDPIDEALARATAQARASAESKGGGDELERLRAELSEAKNRELRAHAELENFRKRTRRDQEEERRYAIVPLLVELLPVVDNIQRAIAAADKAADVGAFVEGMKLVKQQLDSVLARHHVTRIDALGQPFDPAIHEAIGQRPSPDHPPHTVLDVMQEGYMLHDRVLRPAQVFISAGE